MAEICGLFPPGILPPTAGPLQPAPRLKCNPTSNMESKAAENDGSILPTKAANLRCPPMQTAKEPRLGAPTLTPDPGMVSRYSIGRAPASLRQWTQIPRRCNLRGLCGPTVLSKKFPQTTLVGGRERRARGGRTGIRQGESKLVGTHCRRKVGRTTRISLDCIRQLSHFLFGTFHLIDERTFRLMTRTFAPSARLLI